MKEATATIRRRRQPVKPGDRFGRLVLVRQINKNPGAKWETLCDCGNKKVARTASMRNGDTTSCGCRLYETQQDRKTHGMSETPEYKAWANMKNRCQSKNHRQYSEYGGRGIKVCARWQTFETFLADMGKRPNGTTLDRHPDNDGNYEPSNCRWATRKQQQRNRRVCVQITLRGKTQCLTEWAEESGVHRRTVRARLVKGWSIEDAIFKPVIRRHSYPKNT